MTWHAPPALLDGYLADALDGAGAASVEAHLLACPDCRSVLSAHTEAMPEFRHELGLAWDAIVDDLDRPRERWPERALRAVGMSAADARIAAWTPALRLAWFVAVAVVVGFAVAAAHGSTDDPVVFLVLAPLVPLAGVAATFGPAADPLYEVALATATTAWRILVIRTLVVTITAAAILLPASAFVGHLAAAWIAPALAVCAATLALTPRLGALHSALVTGSTWLASVFISVIVATPGGRGRIAPTLAVFRPVGQVVLLAVAVIGLATTWFHRDAIVRPHDLER